MGTATSKIISSITIPSITAKGLHIVQDEYYAECHCAECHCAKCYGAHNFLFILWAPRHPAKQYPP
jgi:hypothetical protein